jgi:electron transport complex protein RnfA
VGTASVITVFTTIGSVAAFLINRLLGEKFSELTLLFYTISVGILYIMLLMALYLISREAFDKYKKYIHISAFNCAVMGTFFTIRENELLSADTLSLTDYIACGFESGLGFIAAALILTAAYKWLNSSKVPSSFRGFPAMLVYLGIISMAVHSLK